MIPSWSPARVVLKQGRVRADNLLVDRIAHAGPGDRGDIVLGWLTRLAVVLGVLGVIGFDLVSLGVGRLHAEDRAQEAARAAVRSYGVDQNLQLAYESALTQLDPLEDGIAPGEFAMAPDGAVTLTVQHTAPTLLVEKIGPIRTWATSRATVTGRPAT